MVLYVPVGFGNRCFMRYIQITKNNVVEVRENTLEILPPNAIQLSDDNFVKLDSGQYRYVDGQFVKIEIKF